MIAAAASSSAAGARPVPFRLLDDFMAQYVKFQGREPRTLEELAIALADNEHRRRLAEVKAMSKNLARLHEFLPALAKRGIKLWPRDIHTSDAGKTLRIYPGMFVGADDKLHTALLELGFREVGRRVSTGNDAVKLQHGRWLVLEIDVSKAGSGGAA